jgi:formate hydrogenlyase subunit 6/NADH:ubiquinone oxidoreductase subunit I
MDTRSDIEKIPIYVMGNRYDVPVGLTIMKALEYAGFKLIRGCGCRGGVCGACVTVYRKKDDYKWRVGLACQTVVEKDIFLVQLPYVPAHKAAYDIRSFKLSEQGVVDLYPELLHCMGCNTCTRSCPMNLEVMNYVSAAITGDWESVKKLSIECIMCGICAARCPAELAPFNIAMLVRRLVGKQNHKTPPHVDRRLKEIADGTYTAELAKLKKMDKQELESLYYEFQDSKGEAV